MNGLERFQALLDSAPTDSLPCMPITMMLAAQHIGVTYWDYATNYHTLVRGQIAVAQAYDFDYVNTMSDPAVEASDCGANVAYYDEQPPAILESDALLQDRRTLIQLRVPDPCVGKRMTNRLNAVQSLVEQVGTQKVVEGWVEGPCAEGADLRGINALMVDFIDAPEFIHDLFTFVIEMETAFAREQIRLGAKVIGIGDAAASLVGPRIYEEFVWPYERRLVNDIHRMGARVRLHICGNTKRILGLMGRLGCDIIDLDSMAPITAARAEMGIGQIVAGNIDPVRVLRNGTPQDVTNGLAQCYRDAGNRYIVAAGCEIPRDTAPANIRAMVKFAREHENQIYE